MKNFSLLTLFAAVAIAVFGISCGTPAATEVGVKTDALDSSAWDVSKWISAADAPVLTSRPEGDRAADGASWFVSTLQCSK